MDVVRRQLGENTRAVHLPQAPVPEQQPLGTPIYRTAAFAFQTSDEYASVLNDERPGYSYSRIDNPTVDAFARAVAALEGPNLPTWPAAQAFASGMAAISGVFLTFARTGAHIVASAATYGGTYSFLRNVAGRFGVETDFVDTTNLDAVRAAMRPATRILYAETIANPTTAVANLPALADIAHETGALFVVDSTLAPPVVCRPLEYGADLVLHSATKYIGGHSDVTGGVVTGRADLISRVRQVRVDTGGSLAPDEAFLLRRGLETLPVRVRRQCSTAMMFAATVSRHPGVRAVDYPGLPQHPGHAVARRLFDAGPEGVRFGAVVTVTPHGGREAGMMFADRLRLAQVATSLGGTHTKVSHAASTTHRQLDSRALESAGIDPGAVRFSIGLEDAEDLISDAYVALDSLGRPLSACAPPASTAGQYCRRSPPAGRSRAGDQRSGRERRNTVDEQGKIRVAVVFGGRSSEHPISCASAAHVLPALDPARYEVVPIGIARDGRWLQVSGDPGRLAIGRGGELPSVDALATPGAEIAARPGGTTGGLTVLSPGDVPRDLGAVDVVLPLLHGAYGEDGTIQGLLEMTGARYCGAGVFASAAGMDKEYMKVIFAAHGLPIGPYVVVRDRDWAAAPVEAQTAPGAVTAGPERKRVLDDIGELGWPVFVKPARGGSSVGTSKARDAAELEQAIETAREHDPKVLVEAAIDGMEIECAVLEGSGGGAPEASLPGQVMVGGGADFYDFEAKYLADETSMVIPAPIPDPAIAEVRRLACAAFDAISCEGLARVDFFYTPGGQVLLNEINTMPGMTPASGFPKMWAATGLPLPQLMDRIIQTALARRPGLR